MLKGILIGIVATLLCALGVWLGVVYTGAYNVAASDRHADIMRWTLDKTMHRSVSARAGEMEADLPERFSAEIVAEGAGHYVEYCEHCHSGPGANRAEWAEGMLPEPPHLHEAAAEWSPEEIHWIVHNGIKMTGMPAFGPHHDGEEIVAITAFVSELPGLSKSDYSRLTRDARAEHDHE